VAKGQAAHTKAADTAPTLTRAEESRLFPDMAARATHLLVTPRCPVSPLVAGRTSLTFQAFPGYPTRRPFPFVGFGQQAVRDYRGRNFSLGRRFQFLRRNDGRQSLYRYIDTALGLAVMQFSDPTTAAHPYQQELTSPQPMRVDLPAGLRRSHLVIACVLDRTGALRNPQVIDSTDAAMTAKVLAALPGWKFSPALRGDVPIEVNAILGFGIDTNDRYK